MTEPPPSPPPQLDHTTVYSNTVRQSIGVGWSSSSCLYVNRLAQQDPQLFLYPFLLEQQLLFVKQYLC